MTFKFGKVDQLVLECPQSTAAQCVLGFRCQCSGRLPKPTSWNTLHLQDSPCASRPQRQRGSEQPKAIRKTFGLRLFAVSTWHWNFPGTLAMVKIWLFLASMKARKLKPSLAVLWNTSGEIIVISTSCSLQTKTYFPGMRCRCNSTECQQLLDHDNIMTTVMMTESKLQKKEKS